MNEDRLRAVIAPAVERVGLELEAVEIIPAGRRRVVRVVVDGDGETGRGPSLDEISEGTRAVSDALDASDVTGAGPFTLEVTSRGTSRPLTEPKHWRRNRGRLVTATFADGESVTGRIADAGDDGAVLTVAGEKKQPDTRRDVAYADVAKAVVQVELNRKSDPTEEEEER